MNDFYLLLNSLRFKNSLTEMTLRRVWARKMHVAFEEGRESARVFDRSRKNSSVFPDNNGRFLAFFVNFWLFVN